MGLFDKLLRGPESETTPLSGREGIGVPTNENFTGTPLPDTRGGSGEGRERGLQPPFRPPLDGAAAPLNLPLMVASSPRFNATITF